MRYASVTSSGGRGAAQASAALQKVLNSEVIGPVALIFGGTPNPDGTKDYRSVEIKAELGRELIELVGTWQSKTKKRRSESAFREYDSSPQPDDELPIQWIDSIGNTHLQNALHALADPSDLTVWTRKDKRVGKPKSFVLEVGLKGNGRVRLFSKITGGKQLRAPGRVVAFLEGRRFQALEEQQVILLEDSFDFAEVNGYLEILKPRGFESLLSYETSLAANATETIDQIEEYIDPDKVDSLRDAVRGNRSLLLRIAGKVRIDLATVDPENVRAAIKKCKFNVTMDTSGDKLKLGFKGENPRDLIRLLTNRGVEAIINKKVFIATSLEEVEQ